MKQLIFSAVICIFFSVNLFAQQTSLLRELLDLPAPPPYSVPDEIDENEDNTPKRPEEFYKKENVPPDDAPIADLIDFWKRQNFLEFPHPNKIKPSERTLQRLVESLDDKPENLDGFLKLLPVNEETAAKVKEIFDLRGQSFDEDSRKTIENWLKYKSKYYSDELLAEARNAKDHKSYNSVIKEQELRALAKVDWEKAEPLLRRLESDSSNPQTAFFAKRLLYEHAIEAKDSSEIVKYRGKFQKVVEDKNASGRQRGAAFDALNQNEDWQGSDDWYVSLLSDATLLELKFDENEVSHPLSSISNKNPDKWIPILAKLVGNTDRAVHNAAVQALVQFQIRGARKDALAPLLPWLSNPNWANTESDGRLRLIQSMNEIEMPESVPGLIWILENDEYSYNRSYAAESLGKYKDPRIVPAMINALQKEPEEIHRRRIILALIRNENLSTDEQMSYLESYVEAISTPEGFENVEQRDEYEEENPLPVAVSIGEYLAKQSEPDENLILRTIERQKILQKEKPEVAKILSGIMSKWQGRLVDLEMLRKISDGKADVETITGALDRRAELNERVKNSLYAMRGKSGLAGAVAACLLMEDNDILSAFRSQDAEKQIGTLACARLIRAELPVNEVGVYLNSENKLFALAAERYLESEDSPEARNLVWAKHPGEALLLGARETFDPANSSASIYENRFLKVENELRKEVLENENLQQIFSLGTHRIRIYADKIIYRWNLDDARYRERTLKKEEFDAFHRDVIEKNIYNRPPVRGDCHHNCATDEFIILNRNGGRRLYMFTASYKLEPYYELFIKLQNDDAKLYYHLSDKIKGLEVLLADEKYSPQAIWKNGDDFRVLIVDNIRKKHIEEDIETLDSADYKNEELDYIEKENRRFERKVQRQYEPFEWRKIENGKLGTAVSEPAELPFLRDKLSFPAIKDLSSNESIWQARTGNYEIRGGEYNKGGLWKVNRAEKIKFKDGLYGFPIISGNWVIAAKADESWAGPNDVVRVNLQTGKEHKVKLPPADNFNPVAFVPTHNKVLLYRAKDDYGYSKSKDNPSPETPEYYLLDANTGKTELVKGEFRPLIEQTFRPLQPTGNPNEFWAAIYDRSKNQTLIGRYDAKNFAMKTVLVVPDISLDSMDIWIDEPEAKVYFIYKGSYFGESHLLSLPLPSEIK